MTDHRAARSASLPKLIGAPGKRSKHGAVHLILGFIPRYAPCSWNAFGHIFRGRRCIAWFIRSNA